MSTIYYPSKILLFGEYTVTQGSGALAIPYFGKKGYWSQAPGIIDQTLLSFQNYLKNKHNDVLDLSRFLFEIREGLSFSSTISQGYGLGSSGALVAAVYDTYAYQKAETLAQVKNVLAEMESFFHGKSSGIDPLVSWLKEPVLVSNSGVSITKLIPSSSQIFLLDSNQKRNTEEWVHRFQEKRQKNTVFHQAVDTLAEVNENIITAFLQGDDSSFWEFGKTLSRLQFEHFPEFIPPGHLDIWESSLLRNDFFLKLCGAGGGGYTLGFSKRMEDVLHGVKNLQPTWIY